MKQELRKYVLKIRDEIPKSQRKEKSKAIVQSVISCHEFQEAHKCLLFSSFRSEVDTTELIRYALSCGKKVYLPKVRGKEMEFYGISSMEDLRDGYQGILEPDENLSTKFISKQNEKIFVLMPGAVFDKNGGRVGYGGGFYDKYLAKLNEEVKPEDLHKVAVAFECQMVEDGVIQREDHDITPDCIITEKTRYPVRINTKRY